jgi:hypothetical protein
MKTPPFLFLGILDKLLEKFNASGECPISPEVKLPHNQ